MSTHILGYPRIGDKRQTKFALEKYWQTPDVDAVRVALDGVLRQNIQDQIDAGLDIITTGDFAHYDQMLTQATAFGVLPKRFADAKTLAPFDRQFYFSRGRDHTQRFDDTRAWQMTKWFDTNYHYLVPEFDGTPFADSDFSEIIHQVKLAKSLTDKPIKVALVGIVSFLYLSSGKPLDYFDKILSDYENLLAELKNLGVAWVQLDEPILALELDGAWQQLFERAYHVLNKSANIIIASYFSDLGDNAHLACHLPVAGLHIDVSFGDESQSLSRVLDYLSDDKILSLGVVSGRSVWRDNASRALDLINTARARHQNLWVGSGSSLLHLPVDISGEDVPSHLDGKLAFARQKLADIRALGDGKAFEGATGITLNTPKDDLTARPDDFDTRHNAQKSRFNLPLLPTTTIGSFPQTPDIRRARKQYKERAISADVYEQAMKDEIAYAVAEQEKLDIDVLVHGEPERTDMVEYFADLMDGFWLSKNGWVQSYGSRCVRPPIVVGDISRPRAMTVKWIKYAQSLTDKPLKGMLTGPITILNWSFAPQDSKSRAILRHQIAHAIDLEVADLQDAGIGMIQIDEPAFREGLPLKASAHAAYWQNAVDTFKHSHKSARVDTQIHTHMCYSSFGDCLEHIKALDADVISIEAARSHHTLVDDLDGYPNAIGVGVYDIHSPRTASTDEMKAVIESALKLSDADKVWVNPDCGLKTRTWEQTRSALANMVEAAKAVRSTLS